MTIHKRTTPENFYRAKELRQNLTPAERKMWSRLRNHQLDGLGFRRQHALGPFIVDLCCNSCKLVIELDGDTHASQVEYDLERTAWLEQHGWKVIRFANREVENEIDAVLLAILQAVTSK